MFYFWPKPLMTLPEFSYYPPDVVPGLTYLNVQNSTLPLSLHVVRMDRHQPELALRVLHSRSQVQGVATMSNMIRKLDPLLGRPLAAINGDFFDRDKPYAGDPRGLEVVDGEVTSAPGAYVSIWFTTNGQVFATNVTALFQVIWPDGSVTPFGLNERRQSNGLALYAPRFGKSTGTTNGLELVLEMEEDETRWPPLRLGASYRARVTAITTNNTPLAKERVVLSIGPALLGKVPLVATGAVLRLNLATTPDLTDVPMAIAGGPILVRDHKAQRIRKPTHEEAPTEWAARVAVERHPRTAIGWNDNYFFLVEVDGRQLKAHLSEGMTLAELAAYMVKLGCHVAVNLDGGGSATFWLDGHTVSKPCDKQERDIANALVVFSQLQSVAEVLDTNAPPDELNDATGVQR